MGAIIIGDIHLPSDKKQHPAKFQQCLDFFNWFVHSEHNSCSEDLILLGDLFDNPYPNPESILAVEQFFGALKVNSVHVVTGNHDTDPYENANVILQGIGKEFNCGLYVYELETMFSLNNGKFKCLAMPHFDGEKYGRRPLWEYYNNMDTESPVYNYVFHHLEDTEVFSGDKAINLKRLFPQSKIVGGHVHTETISHGGNYLGSVCKNSSAERNDTKVIGIINYADGSFRVESIPNFMDYVDVDYPNVVEKPKKPTIYLINKAPNRPEAESFYGKILEGCDEVEIGRVTTILQETVATEKEEKELSDNKTMVEQFCKEAGMPDSIKNKMLSVLD